MMSNHMGMRTGRVGSTSTGTAETWVQAIEAFAYDHRGTHSATTLAVLTRRLARAGHDLGGLPWKVSREGVDTWLAGMGGQASTVKAYRYALHTFYLWAIQTGRLTADPVSPGATVTRYRLEARWQDALDQFERSQRERGIAPSTVQNRLKCVQRFAVEVQRSPWKVTTRQIQAWLDRTALAPTTRTGEGSALRAFYLWAARAGHISHNPMPDPGRAQRKELPVVWEEPVTAWRRALRGSGLADTTVKVKIELLSQFARDHASLDPFTVTTDDILDWFGGKKWSRERRRSARGTLRGFYQWANDTERAHDNPALKLPVVKTTPPHPRPATEDDYAAALAGATEREALALRCAAELGMRRGEVAVIHVQDVVSHEGLPALLVHGKGDRERLIPLPAGLAAQITHHGEGYVFPGQTAGHISARWLGRIIARALPGTTTMHQLRHRFASLAYSVNRDLLTVQHLLGHSSPATTQRYVQVPESSQRYLVEAVARSGSAS